MARKYLGLPFDIHGGGLENIFPHHESEIAQSEGATGVRFARIWMHNNMVTVDGRKMGKSLGNFTLLKDIFSRFDPMVVRLYVLRSHYRSPLDFSDEGLDSAKSGLERLSSFRGRLGDISTEESDISPGAAAIAAEAEAVFTASMNDDLNTPGAIAAVFDLVRAGNALLDSSDTPGDRACLANVIDTMVGDILGIRLSAASDGAGVDDLCSILGEVRGYLRQNRLFDQTDHMRDRLEETGFIAKDLPGGVSEIRKK